MGSLAFCPAASCTPELARSGLSCAIAKLTPESASGLCACGAVWAGLGDSGIGGVEPSPSLGGGATERSHDGSCGNAGESSGIVTEAATCPFHCTVEERLGVANSGPPADGTSGGATPAGESSAGGNEVASSTVPAVAVDGRLGTEASAGGFISASTAGAEGVASGATPVATARLEAPFGLAPRAKAVTFCRTLPVCGGADSPAVGAAEGGAAGNCAAKNCANAPNAGEVVVCPDVPPREAALAEEPLPALPE